MIAAIQNVKIDLPNKKVYVTTTLGHDEILEAIKKAGKPCSYVGVKKE